MTPSEKQALIATRATLLVFQHAVESGMVESDLKMAHQLAEAAIDKVDTALAAADAVAELQPCEMGEMCLGCQPRSPDGSCPGKQQPNQLPDAGKMAAALRAIADGTVTGGQSKSYFATLLAHQELARKTLETDAERMAGARAKYDDSYPGDLLARVEDDPK